MQIQCFVSCGFSAVLCHNAGCSCIMHTVLLLFTTQASLFELVGMRMLVPQCFMNAWAFCLQYINCTTRSSILTQHITCIIIPIRQLALVRGCDCAVTVCIAVTKPGFKYVPREGTTKAKGAACNANTFNVGLNYAETCTPCPAGFSTNGVEGSDSPQDCCK